jgi:hypothetical protein
MKKNLAIIGMIGIMASNANAVEDKNLYLGFGLSSGSGTQTRDYTSTYYTQGGTYETEYDASGKTIKLGYIFESKNRFEFSISSFDAKRTAGQTFNMNTNDVQNSKFTGYDLDWLFTFRNKEALQPYLGLGFGVYKNNDIDGYNTTTGNSDTATGLALNLMGGATYHFNDTFELEAAYKSKYIGWNLENPDMKENIGSLYFGANIKF